ncbi:MAG: carbamoyltransferase HypF [candidate division WOR-3 bacterium]
MELSGQVQGIGFRPFVYRLAHRYQIKGIVANTSSGVVIFAQGKNLKRFYQALLKNPPPLAQIDRVKFSWKRGQKFSRFTIISSRKQAAEIRALVLPDLNICSNCRQELFTATDRRFYYPFINCTQCGPRYSIIFNLPYDRKRTTMKSFRMCPDCQKEYNEPSNRRFHAEPIACPICGPVVRLVDHKGREIKGDPLLNAARLLLKGKILAVKGLGGFHLACDATNDQAVLTLRKRKERSRKPLALMVDEPATARRFCHLSSGAVKVLKSPAAPIVLLPKKCSPEIPVSQLIAPDNPALGVMCAYTPLHLILFQKLKQLGAVKPVLVMTSANFSDEPIAIDEHTLLNRFNKLFDFALVHNREIANRCDDSVVQIDSRKPLIVRRSRGYVPQPLNLGSMFHVKHPALAVGADGKNCFALAEGNRVFFGPHIGELDTAEAEAFFISALKRLSGWTGIKPKLVVCDLHPDYNSVLLARRLAIRYRARLIQVQHHYAHILSVMAEHRLSGPVLGLAADGTGYGVDGAIWGCEFLLINKDLSWQRIGNLGYLQHQAGANIVANPVQVAVSYLFQCGLSPQVITRLGLNPAGVIKSPPVTTSSLGRLFDAAAAITGICRQATFDGEPAIALEAAASQSKNTSRLKLNEHQQFYCANGRLIINPKPFLLAMVNGILNQEPPAAIARWFHLRLAGVLSQAVIKLCHRYRVRTVCLSGGSMQNRLLRSVAVSTIRKAGFKVFFNRAVPLNDGGIALGQIIAAVK